VAEIPCLYCETRPRPNPECGGCRGRGLVHCVDLTSVDDLGHVQYRELTGTRLVKLSCVVTGSVDVLEEPVAWLSQHGLVTYRCRAIRKIPMVRSIGARPSLQDRDAWSTIHRRIVEDVWLPWFSDRGWERVESYPSSRMRSPSGNVYDLSRGPTCEAVDVALWREHVDVADELARVERIRDRVARRFLIGRGEAARG
jgi:hypothetical protein